MGRNPQFEGFYCETFAGMVIENTDLTSVTLGRVTAIFS